MADSANTGSTVCGKAIVVEEKKTSGQEIHQKITSPANLCSFCRGKSPETGSHDLPLRSSSVVVDHGPPLSVETPRESKNAASAGCCPQKTASNTATGWLGTVGNHQKRAQPRKEERPHLLAQIRCEKHSQTRCVGHRREKNNNKKHCFLQKTLM